MNKIKTRKTLWILYILYRLLLLLRKYIVGPRAKIVALTSFFTFTFALMLFALVQNYVHAGVASLVPDRGDSIVNTADIQPSIDHEIVPSYGVHHQENDFDFDTDDSYQRFLTTNRPFKDLDYVPSDLAPINSNFTANDARKFKLRQKAGDMFADMAWHFWDDFTGDRLIIFSAYRSKSYQDELIRRGCNANVCAKGGTSEHQAGLAVDLRVMTKGGKSISLDTPNKYTDRLKANANTFGFHNTYQRGVAVDGKIVEGRHRRYLGTALAKILTENNQTLAEYYTSIQH